MKIEDLRRLRTVKIPMECVRRLFTPGNDLGSLPAGAQMIRMYEEPAIQAECIVFRHDSFDVVGEAAEAPWEEIAWDNADRTVYWASDRKDRDVVGARYVSMSYETFSMLFWDGRYIEHDLPTDIALSKMHDIPERRVVEIAFESNKFEPPRENGGVTEQLDPAEWNLTIASNDTSDLQSYTD